MHRWALELLLSVLVASALMPGLSWMHFVGPAWAGEVPASPHAPPGSGHEAWVAQYRVRDAGGERALVVARSEDRIEYRTPGQPVRAWRKVGDGLEHREIFAADKQVVVYSPGDLRALGQSQDWTQLGGLVDPAIRSGLRDTGSTQVAGQRALRLRGTRDGARIELDWLGDIDLPARYRRITPEGPFELTLRALKRIPVAEAFVETQGFREVDYADIGDMEQDPFARQYIHQGF